jgi:antitoxin Phd
MKTIQLKDAKATLSAVVDEAVAGRPSLITRHGKEEAVVISVVEYKRLTNKIPSFGELLMSFPGGADDLPLRSRKPLRDLF